MARKNTNKQFSLRKLKTGTASVAVALCVLGAGLTTENTVLAQEQGYNLAQTSEKYLDELFDKVSDFLNKTDGLESATQEVHRLREEAKEKLESNRYDNKTYVDYINKLEKYLESII